MSQVLRGHLPHTRAPTTHNTAYPRERSHCFSFFFHLSREGTQGKLVAMLDTRRQPARQIQRGVLGNKVNGFARRIVRAALSSFGSLKTPALFRLSTSQRKFRSLTFSRLWLPVRRRKRYNRKLVLLVDKTVNNGEYPTLVDGLIE